MPEHVGAPLSPAGRRDTNEQAAELVSMLLSLDQSSIEHDPEPNSQDLSSSSPSSAVCQLPSSGEIVKAEGDRHRHLELPKWRNGVVGDHAWSPLFPTDRELKRIADRHFEENSTRKHEARASKFPTKAGADLRRAQSELTRKPHFMTGGHSQAPLWRTAEGRLGGRAACTPLRSGQLAASFSAQADSADVTAAETAQDQRELLRGFHPREGRSPKRAAEAQLPVDCSRCPQGHLLQECATPNTGWVCDVCLMSRLSDSYLWRCGFCAWRVCDKCRYKGQRDVALAPQEPESPSHSGISASSSTALRVAKNHYEPRYEPAKVRDGQGRRQGLKGVQSDSDIQQFHRTIDPYSRRSFDVRQEFKKRHQEQLGATAAATWKAMYKWQAAEKPLDSFCENPPKDQKAKNYYKFRSK